MSTATRLGDLLLEWQESRAQGQPATAASLCADCPELVSELQRQIDALQKMEALLDLTPREDAFPLPIPACDSVELPGYDLLAVLGHGGMAIVYRARHQKLGRVVAIKTLLNGCFARADQLSRFMREAEAMARMQHPNVVGIHEFGEHAGRLYFVMELLEGGNLARKLQNRLLSVREAAELTQTLARAVQYGHDHGIIHRDLKPANILLTREGTPKVSDFGLARLVQTEAADVSAGLTQDGAVLGTASYMAPEQAAGRSDVGTLADVYALGAILYETLTGRPPFRGETTLDTLEQVRTQEPIAPANLRPGLPRDLETICMKCLDKEPAKRYGSAGALADDLDRFLAREPILARPAPLTRRAVRWVRRRPVQAVLALAAICILALWGRFTFLLHDRNALAERQSRLAHEQNLRAQAILRRALAAIEQHARSTANLKMAPANRADPATVLFQLAAVYAQASAAMGRATDLAPADGGALKEQYAARAVELLESARQLQFFEDPSHRRRLLDEADLSPLRERTDFARLLRSVR